MGGTQIGERLIKLNGDADKLESDVQKRFKQLNSSFDQLLSKLGKSKSTSTPIQVERPPVILSKSRRNLSCEVSCITTSLRRHNVDEIDRQLGNIYGTAELREAINEAIPRMKKANEVLGLVDAQHLSPFVHAEIKHLTSNINVIDNIFKRMLDRMDLPDTESLLEEKVDDPTSSRNARNKTETSIGPSKPQK